MSQSKPTPIKKIPTAAALDDQPLVTKFKMRGVPYELHEMDITDYDKLVTLCTATKMVDGTETEEINEGLLIRMMIERVLVTPPWAKVHKSVRIIRALEREVRDLHFGLEPIERPKKEGEEDDDDDDDDDDAAEDEPDPNASGG